MELLLVVAANIPAMPVLASAFHPHIPDETVIGSSPLTADPHPRPQRLRSQANRNEVEPSRPAWSERIDGAGFASAEQGRPITPKAPQVARIWVVTPGVGTTWRQISDVQGGVRRRCRRRRG